MHTNGIGIIIFLWQKSTCWDISDSRDREANEVGMRWREGGSGGGEFAVGLIRALVWSVKVGSVNWIDQVCVQALVGI